MFFSILFFILWICFNADPLFFETFEDPGAEKRWIKTKNSSFLGNWIIASSSTDTADERVKGLLTQTPGQKHCISTQTHFVANSSTFIFQFEVKIEQTPHSCGGAYLKLYNSPINPDTVSDTTPYVIMFGPDHCSNNNGLQFIYRAQNPNSKRWIEHCLLKPISTDWSNRTHLYRLMISEHNLFSISIDNKTVISDSLSNPRLFNETFVAPETIDDPTAQKPADWDDRETILAPNQTKPADWDEDAPEFIPDESAVKPDAWDEEEPLYIIDKTAQKPAEWRDDEDGKWEYPMIPNPVCINAPSSPTDTSARRALDHQPRFCGPWKPPMKRNPAYRGKWEPTARIPNPAYRGVWHPPQIPNPEHCPLPPLAAVGEVFGVGTDIVVASGAVLFSNIFVGTRTADADAAAQRWAVRSAAEAAAAAAKPAQVINDEDDEEFDRLWGVQKGKQGAKGESDLLDFFTDVFTRLSNLLVSSLNRSPIRTVFAIVGCMFVFVLLLSALIYGLAAWCCPMQPSLGRVHSFDRRSFRPVGPHGEKLSFFARQRALRAAAKAEAERQKAIAAAEDAEILRMANENIRRREEREKEEEEKREKWLAERRKTLELLAKTQKMLNEMKKKEKEEQLAKEKARKEREERRARGEVVSESSSETETESESQSSSLSSRSKESSSTSSKDHSTHQSATAESQKEAEEAAVQLSIPAPMPQTIQQELSDKDSQKKEENENAERREDVQPKTSKKQQTQNKQRKIQSKKSKAD